MIASKKATKSWVDGRHYLMKSHQGGTPWQMQDSPFFNSVPPWYMRERELGQIMMTFKAHSLDENILYAEAVSCKV